MDRSFLSRPEVVAASRAFVCVRLATYENKEEGDFLKTLVPTGSGELENTAFAVLSPDGRRLLTRAARSARETFGDARRMAESLNRIAARYLAKAGPAALPEVANVRLALDVAACDGRPLVVLFGTDLRHLRDRLAPLAWEESFLGRFIYAAASTGKDLATIKGTKPAAGVIVVQPDRFGLAGTVLAQATADSPLGDLRRCLREGLARHRAAAESFGYHARAGHQQGVYWETVLPVTDPMERQARDRGRGLPPD
jgi:hypothetical protein